MMIGERRSDLKASYDRRAIPNSSGLLPKVDTKGIIPDLVEEVVPDHIEMVVDSEANREIEALALALALVIEKSRQRDRRAIC